MKTKIKKALKTNHILFYGIDFYLRKTEKDWNLYYKDHKARSPYTKTKKRALYNAIGELILRGKQSTLKAVKRIDGQSVKNKLFIKKQPLFKRLFGFSIPYCRYSLLRGDKAIDAVAFDKRINTPSGISTYDFVSKQYGDMACRLIKSLI